jgi:hypothetical protein
MKRTVIAAAAFFSFAAFGESEQAAISEVVSPLNSARSEVMTAYEVNGKDFPFKLDVAMRSKYVSAISYNSGPSVASVVATITDTSNTNLDGKMLGLFATVKYGTVTWMCGTAATSTATLPSAVIAMYPYLPEECRHSWFGICQSL